MVNFKSFIVHLFILTGVLLGVFAESVYLKFLFFGVTGFLVAMWYIYLPRNKKMSVEMKAIKCKLGLYLMKMYSEHNTLLHKMNLPRWFITTRDEIKGKSGDYFYVPSMKKEYFRLINVFTIDQKSLDALGFDCDIFQYVADQWWKHEGFSSPENMEDTLRKIYPEAKVLYVHVMREVDMDD